MCGLVMDGVVSDMLTLPIIFRSVNRLAASQLAARSLLSAPCRLLMGGTAANTSKARRISDLGIANQ